VALAMLLAWYTGSWLLMKGRLARDVLFPKLVLANKRISCIIPAQT
jgi:hypothetical protein